MKKDVKLILLAALITLNMIGCKSEEEKDAEEAVEDYTKYVDSISNIATSEAMANWESIQLDLEKAKIRAEISLENAADRKELQSLIDKGYTQFDAYKNTVIAAKNKEENLRLNNPIRSELFGKVSVANDLEFEWVNKDNILEVYQNFVSTVKKNKDSYSTEEWDEIKRLYEELDSRKNIVEKQGLSSSDNNKIALIKLKFGPMYTLNRLGSVSEKKLNSKK